MTVEVTPDQRRQALLQMLAQQNDPSVERAREQSNRRSNISNIGQAVEGLLRARGQAAGGQGANNDFYKSMREQGRQGVSDATNQRRDALRKMIMAKNIDDQSTAQTLAGEQKDYSRDRDVLSDQRSDERMSFDKQKWEDQKSKPKPPRNVFGMQTDPFGRAYRLNKETGETTLVSDEMGAAPQVGQSGGDDQPPAPMKGELPEQYKLRLKLWGQDKSRKEKPLSPKEHASMTFSQRMSQAEDVFTKLGDKGYDRSDYSSAIAASVTPDFMKSEELKRQDQAERNFVNATLREESGAAIAESEFESAEKQYFPRAGDSEEVLRQKTQNRKTVIDGMRRAARMDDGTTAPSAQSQQPAQQPAPHGTRVRQNGKVFVWDGQQYTEE